LVPGQLRRKGSASIEPMLLDPQLERRLAESFTVDAGSIDPAIALSIREQAEAFANAVPHGRAVLLCTAAIRPLIADFFGRSGLSIDVYSYAEVPPEIRLLPVGVIKEATPAPLQPQLRS
jgi:flagellar biosynthesis component FlhA